MTDTSTAIVASVGITHFTGNRQIAFADRLAPDLNPTVAFDIQSTFNFRPRIIAAVSPA